MFHACRLVISPLLADIDPFAPSLTTAKDLQRRLQRIHEHGSEDANENSAANVTSSGEEDPELPHKRRQVAALLKGMFAECSKATLPASEAILLLQNIGQLTLDKQPPALNNS